MLRNYCSATEITSQIAPFVPVAIQGESGAIHVLLGRVCTRCATFYFNRRKSFLIMQIAVVCGGDIKSSSEEISVLAATGARFAYDALPYRLNICLVLVSKRPVANINSSEAGCFVKEANIALKLNYTILALDAKRYCCKMNYEYCLV